MKKLMLLLLLVAATGAFAVTRQEDKPDMLMRKDCLMDIRGVDVAASDIPNGTAITFTTITANVAELQRRVERMAHMYNLPLDRSSVPMPDRLIPGTAEYERVHKGARLILVPKDQAQLDNFRAQVPERAEMMRNSVCPRMQMK